MKVITVGEYTGEYRIKDGEVHVYYNGTYKPTQTGGMSGNEEELAKMLLRELVVADNQKQNA